MYAAMIEVKGANEGVHAHTSEDRCGRSLISK